MEIKSAEFVVSNTDVRKCPESKMPEKATKPEMPSTRPFSEGWGRT